MANTFKYIINDNTYCSKYDPFNGYPYNIQYNEDNVGLPIIQGMTTPIDGNTLSNPYTYRIRGAMYDKDGNNIPFMIIQRTITGKRTPIRLSNSVEIFEPSYRSNLQIHIDNLSKEDFLLYSRESHFQLVCFNGLPIIPQKIEPCYQCLDFSPCELEQDLCQLCTELCIHDCPICYKKVKDIYKVPCCNLELCNECWRTTHNKNPKCPQCRASLPSFKIHGIIKSIYKNK